MVSEFYGHLEQCDDVKCFDISLCKLQEIGYMNSKKLPKDNIDTMTSMYGKPFQVFLENLYAESKTLPLELDGNNLHGFSQQLNMSIQVASLIHANAVMIHLPSSARDVKTHIRDNLHKEFVDMLFISRTFKDVNQRHVIDIVMRTSVLFPTTEIQQIIEQFVWDLGIGIHDQTNTHNDGSLKMRTDVVFIQDIQSPTSQSLVYQRNNVMQKCFSVVPFPENIICFFINCYNELKTGDTLFKLNLSKSSFTQNFDYIRQSPSSENIFRTNDIVYSQATLGMDLALDDSKDPFSSLFRDDQSTGCKRKTKMRAKEDQFRGTEFIWAKLRLTFQEQIWKHVASLMFMERQRIQSLVQTSKRELKNQEDFHEDYDQVGFTEHTSHNVRETDRIDFNHSAIQSTRDVFQQWARNKNVDNLVRCLLYMAIHELRESGCVHSNFLNDHNFEHIVSKSRDLFLQELVDHNSIKFNEVIHPHPLVSFRSKLTDGFSLQLEEPFAMGILYAISALCSYKLISNQVCVIDKKRKCDDGTTVLCGESRSGKSIFLDCLTRFFGGYDWLKTNANFQSPTLQNKSLCCVEEMEIGQLKNEKSGANMWKKRLDQTTSCDCDIKGKQGFIGLKNVPFFITTNKKPAWILQNVEYAFYKRLNVVLFSCPLWHIESELINLPPEEAKWAHDRENQDDIVIKQRVANLILLGHLLFPPKELSRRFYYIDDIICEHIIKILIHNRHSYLLYIALGLGRLETISKILDFYMQNTGIHGPNASKQAFINAPHVFKLMCENKDFMVLICGMGKDLGIDHGEFMSEMQLRPHTYVHMAKLVGNAIIEKKKPWFNRISDIKSILSKVLPETNTKRHLLRMWDTSLVRLGFN